ncbi:MAG: histidine kinase [Microbacteriaceae bacterium]|nr:histidine kinase [Microbacteriaceae bacterium]
MLIGYGGPGRPSLAGALLARGSRRWYVGGSVALLWLVTAGVEIWTMYPGAGVRLGTTALLVLFGAAFIATPPLSGLLPPRLRLLPALGIVALSFTLFPWIGFEVSSLWTYAGVAAAMSFARFRSLVAFIVVLAGTALWFQYLEGVPSDSVYFAPLIILSISLMMAAFGRQIAAIQQLRATQQELARLAVEDERSRVARDLHDILGHSLTVITVKAELAGRLVQADPARAAAEIADVEDLARGALADVRSTVAGFRGVSIATELAGARVALESAGILASVPGTADVVPSDARELFGWVVREGVTNVVRHSGATRATIRLAADSVEVTDDGLGPTDAATDGNGLAGLRERVDAAGASLTVGRSESGGFRLAVTTRRA